MCHTKKGCAPPQHHKQAAMHLSLSPLFLHHYFHVFLFETKASTEKAIGSAVKPFSNEN
jgi:hypothetical protein